MASKLNITLWIDYKDEALDKIRFSSTDAARSHFSTLDAREIYGAWIDIGSQDQLGASQVNLK